MRRMAVLQQHCGHLSAVQAHAIMRAAPTPAVARHHVRHQHRFQHGSHMQQPASVHAPALQQRCGLQTRSRSAALCAMGTDARSGQHQQQQQQPISQSDHRQQGTAAGPSWDIKMLYDGDCPLCMREVNMLKRRDAEQGRIAFVDIASPDYSPAKNADISYEQAMGEIHAIEKDGTVIRNVQVFARLYEAVGLGWVYGFTKYEPLRKAADAVYGVWAKYRLPITGREDFQTILRRRDERTCK